MYTHWFKLGKLPFRLRADPELKDEGSLLRYFSLCLASHHSTAL